MSYVTLHLMFIMSRVCRVQCLSVQGRLQYLIIVLVFLICVRTQRVHIHCVGIQFWHICFSGTLPYSHTLLVFLSLSHSPLSLSLSLFKSLPLSLIHSLPHLSLSPDYNRCTAFCVRNALCVGFLVQIFYSWHSVQML